MIIRNIAITALKLVILTAICLQLISCSSHQQEREFNSYLCEVNADGSGFKILVRNSFQSQGSDINTALLRQFPFMIQYGHGEELFVFRDDGMFRFNPEANAVEALFDSNVFNYQPNNYLHCPADSTRYYIFAGNDLYRIIRAGFNYFYHTSAVGSCVGIPFTDQLSILSPEGTNLSWMDNGEFNSPPIILPHPAQRAFYFEQLEMAVYASHDEIRKCDSNGLQDTLLYQLNSSANSTRTFYPIDDAGVFLTTNRFKADEHLLLIDAKSGSSTDLGKISFAKAPNDIYLPFQISFTRNRTKLLFFDSTALYLFDAASLSKETVLISTAANFNLRNISSASISMDGSKIRFICDLYRYKD